MYELFVSAIWIDSEVQKSVREIVYAFLAAASVGTSLAALATFLESCLGTRSETPSQCPLLPNLPGRGCLLACSSTA